MSPNWCHHWKSLGILLCDVAAPVSDMGSAAAAGGKGTSAPALNETLPRQMLGFQQENFQMDQNAPNIEMQHPKGAERFVLQYKMEVSIILI